MDYDDLHCHIKALDKDLHMTYFVDIVGDYDDVQSSRPVSGGVTPKVEVRDYTEPLYDEPAAPEEGYENLRPPSSAPSDIRIRSTVLVSTGVSGILLVICCDSTSVASVES